MIRVSVQTLAIRLEDYSTFDPSLDTSGCISSIVIDRFLVRFIILIINYNIYPSLDNLMSFTPTRVWANLDYNNITFNDNFVNRTHMSYMIRTRTSSGRANGGHFPQYKNVYYSVVCYTRIYSRYIYIYVYVLRYNKINNPNILI